MGDGAPDRGDPGLVEELERHRAELTGYCYRMLGSGFEAEDAVQETLVKAWRGLDRYDPDRAPLRSWLFQIATNVCVDMLRGAQRRARAMDLGPAGSPGPDLGPPLPGHAWVMPIPDRRVLPSDPAELAVERETVRLAFVAALQHLPPRQRAVLILRDVLRWSAAEVAELLEGSVASVNSALQRARATLSEVPAGGGEVDRRLLERYVDAFERYDVSGLVALLHEDATMSMPPFAWWLRGREEIRKAMLAADAPCGGSRLVPAGTANGCPAFGQYLGGEPFALLVVEVSGDRVSATTTYLDTRLFPLFGLPMSFAGPPRIGE
ncbi:sigma-70 family RNA polymerase sigma factor [Nonomuraea aurantiaca]|uniref:sigma-70 family RNA polymerase sigma factor n=1 Tax=Nonomuraea aurantiaca TaxID=2878562 RepID=UPI001CD9A958|nr:sigma-70 family RNA polymerase sigma factor [Nonomuraea aurantiaca]MCA2224309.1 sigma-70 family RNA polymerase sigma factor [Nonomuraea aurantiaca]